MKVGSLVQSRHDPGYHGIVLDIASDQVDHYGRRACRVQWRDGEETCEFVELLEVISEGK